MKPKTKLNILYLLLILPAILFCSKSSPTENDNDNGPSNENRYQRGDLSPRFRAA